MPGLHSSSQEKSPLPSFVGAQFIASLGVMNHAPTTPLSPRAQKCP